MTEVRDPMPAHRTVEVDRPQRHARCRRHVADDECRMVEVEFEVQSVALVSADNQRRFEVDFDGDRLAARAPFSSLNLDLVGRDRRPGRCSKSRLRIGRGRQHDVTRIPGDRERGARVAANRNRGIAEELRYLVELLEIDHLARRGRVHGDRRTATGALECDRLHLDRDRGPILGRRVTDQHGQRH